MGKITITVVDVTGNKEEQATVPDDAPVNRIIAKLVELLGLPLTDPGANPISYRFQHKASGRELQDNQTLAEAGVKEGDVLRLQPELTAGESRS